MTEFDNSARLERRYRQLLLAYPSDYRAVRGDEMITTLMSDARPGQRRPSIGDALDLIWSGLRTRARLSRGVGPGPIAAGALDYAGGVMLVVASGVASALAIGIGSRGMTMFGPGHAQNETYPIAVRVALTALLLVFPVALVALGMGRDRIARWLALAGGVGSAGFASWLVVYADRTSKEGIEASNLFGLMTVLGLPAVLLFLGRSAPAESRKAPRLIYAALLSAAVVIENGFELYARARLATLGPEGVVLGGQEAVGPATVHDTGLTQGVVVVLGIVFGWQLLRAVAADRDPRHSLTAWILSLPALAYAIGTLVTPGLFRDHEPWHEGLPGRVVETGAALVAVIVLGGFYLAAMRQSSIQANRSE